MVNSGEIKLLNNHKIIEGLQRLEELYVYVNRMEAIHFDVIKLYVMPNVMGNIKIKSLQAKNPDRLYKFDFQNQFIMSMEIMKEKHEVYIDILTEIEKIIELIDLELVD